MKVSELYELSTASFSLYGLDDELYDNYILPGSLEDSLTFYCWLEWKDYFVEFDWLLELDPSVPKPTNLSIASHASSTRRFGGPPKLQISTSSTLNTPNQLQRSPSSSFDQTSSPSHKKQRRNSGIYD
jgi:hypothetical protein